MADFRIDIPVKWTNWSNGVKVVARTVHAQAPVWEVANEVFFDRTQQYVHVLSGDLKTSGQQETQAIGGGQIEATVSYGGEDVDYAEYELKRGGEHDFLGRGWEESQDTFQHVFGRVWDNLTQAWDRGTA